MAELRYLKDADGNIIYPVTHTDAIIGDINNNEYQTITDTNLSTGNKTVVGAINEIYQNVNNGKQLIADAIGEPLSTEDTFAAMGGDINGLLSTFKTNMMNNGVTVESSDKFKSLIDKIATMAEEGGGKGIQYAEGTIGDISVPTVSSEKDYVVTVNNLPFKPTLIVIDIGTMKIKDAYGYVKSESYPFTISNLTHSKKGSNRLYVGFNGSSYIAGMNLWINNITDNSFDFNYSIISDDYYGGQINYFGNIKYYVIEVGEEDTTLRDSLASILIEEGVEVSEEDDMAGLISKVDEELDRKNEEIAAKEEELANSGLDIISATELPATGKENQICVITDTPFDSVIISTKNDEIYTESNKIILYSVDPRYSIKNTAFNATINNFTYDFHISKIKQGNVNKESYYYRNNIWNELSYTSLPIVKDGAYTNYLGTFTHATNVAGISSDGSGFWLYQNGSAMGSCGLCTSNNTKINFSDYTQIKINLKMNTANKSRTIQFGTCSVANAYYNGYNDNTCRTTVDSVEYVSITIKPTDTEYHEYILDISNITGEYYIYAHIPQASDTTRIYYYFKDIEFI